MKTSRHKNFLFVVLSLIFLTGILPLASSEAVPQTMNYQGYLTDANGSPVNGTVSMNFAFYNVPTNGQALWSEVQSNVTVNNGLYDVILGSVTPINLPFDTQYYLGVTVGTDPEMMPRQALTMVPYAFRAVQADSVSPGVSISTQNQIISNVPEGTAPFWIVSTTLVPNLNADAVDGWHATAFSLTGHLHGGSDITSGSVAIATGGTGATNAASALSNLGAAAATHNHDTVYQKKYGKVAVVAQSNGDYISPVTAMTNIATWCGTPSASNPCLLKIMPGVYPIGTSSLQMQNYVDVEGSGENTTKISGTAGSTISGVIRGASNAELRSLTVENTGGGLYATGIYNNNPLLKVTQVTVAASGGTYQNYGVYITSASTIMTNVTVTVSGGAQTQNYGIYNSASASTMMNVSATASGSGWDNYGMYNSYVSCPTLTNVSVSASGGSVMNVGIFNSSCQERQTLTGVTAAASGGSSSRGIWNSGCNYQTMTNVTAAASDGTDNRGVYNVGSYYPTMTNVTATASGGTTNYGIYNAGGSLATMVHVSALASGGTNANVGIYHERSSSTISYGTVRGSDIGIVNYSTLTNFASVAILSSVVTGVTAIKNEGADAYIRVGGSMLNGVVNVVSGTVTCLGVYTAFAFYPNTCP